MSGLAGALAAVEFVVAGLWRDAEQARDAAETAMADEQTAKRKVEALLGIESGLRGDLQGAYGKLESALQGEQVARGDVQKAEREVAYLNYAHAVDLAYREYQAGNITRARELLDGCPEDLRRWEWHHVHRLCHQDLVTLRGHAVRVESASFSPDGGGC